MLARVEGLLTRTRHQKAGRTPMTTHTPEGVETTVEENAFRARVRTFLDGHASRKAEGEHGAQGLDEREVPRARAYQDALFQAGLAGLTWPLEYGGQGLSSRYQTIFNEEVAGFDVPADVFSIGFGTCIPTVLAHGTEEQKQRYVRPAARGEEIWCQLLSEPAAGSDVGSLRSTAERHGDEWVLNGQKVWTTGAHYCQYGLVLARTDPEQPKHRGLSMFILNMKSPGLTIRPLRQMNGAADFNEVFFDDVRIPADHLVAAPGDGWRVLLTSLMNERVAIGTRRSTEKISPLSLIGVHLELARRRGINDDQTVRQELADLLVRSWVLDMVGMRIQGAVAAGRVPGPEGSIAKLARSILARRSAELACRLAGPAAVAWPSGDIEAEQPSQLMLFAPSLSIAGGTSEIMRNILGERVLGLPKEPQVDRDLSFRDLAHN
jgi:alkylation response protein AidB-like acyl-CoA dehydrogenase